MLLRFATTGTGIVYLERTDDAGRVTIERGNQTLGYRAHDNPRAITVDLDPLVASFWAAKPLCVAHEFECRSVA